MNRESPAVQLADLIEALANAQSATSHITLAAMQAMTGGQQALDPRISIPCDAVSRLVQALEVAAKLSTAITPARGIEIKTTLLRTYDAIKAAEQRDPPLPHIALFSKEPCA